MRKYALLLLIILILSSFYKVIEFDKVNWIQFSDLPSKLQQDHKPVIIDVYTDWCHWCKVMDKETYQNEKVAKYINENYHAIRFNAESREPIIFRNSTYIYNEQYKINNLAINLSNGQLSFPTTIIIPDEKSQPIALAGYLKPGELEIVIKYFGSGEYKTKTFPEFQKTFHISWKN